jgi:hypothetical protein
MKYPALLLILVALAGCHDGVTSTEPLTEMPPKCYAQRIHGIPEPLPSGCEDKVHWVCGKVACWTKLNTDMKS